MDFIVKKWPAVLLLFVMLTLIFISFNRVVGGFNEYLLSKHLTYWNEQEDDPTVADVVKMERFYQTAIDNMPHDPALLQLGGHLSEWQAYIAEDDHKEQYFSEALVRYRLSIKERPTWPYTWFDLAKAKIRASEVDDEFKSALRTTMRLGPNERKLQIGILQLGLLTWIELDEQTQGIVMGVVNVVMQREPKKLYLAVEKYNRVELLCSLVSGDVWLDLECSKFVELTNIEQ